MEKSREEIPTQGVAAADAPPPSTADAPPPPTAVKDGAIPAEHPNPPPVAEEDEEEEGFFKSCMRSFRFLITVFILSIVWRNIRLGFELDSVSVSIHEDRSRANVTAVWDLGFSTRREVRDLNVSARFMSRDFQLETRDFQVETANATNGNATVSMVLPPDFVVPASGGLVLEQVIFDCNFEPRYGLKAACENVTVEFSPDEAKWILKGGPMSCPFVSYGHSYFFSYVVSFDKIFSYVSRLTNK